METEVFTETVAPSDLQDAELPTEAVEERTDAEQLDSGLELPDVSVSELFTHEQLASSLQQLVNELNTKRKRDPAILDGFKKSLLVHTESAYAALEQSMYSVYEQNNQVIEAKLQELTEVLGRICKLECELQQFKHNLGLLYTDVQDN